MKKFALVLLFMVVIFPIARAAENDVTNHPGFVDFSVLTSLVSAEPTVEISLKAPLLSMMTNLIREEEAEAANFISKLMRVTVNVFDSQDIDVDEISTSMETVASRLDEQGWERVVRVREDDEHVDIYFRISDDAELIHGIAIMVAEPGETVLVNIVGDINSNDIAAVGRRFDIDELSDFESRDQ